MGPSEKQVRLLEQERWDISYRKPKRIEQEPEVPPAPPQTSRPTRSAKADQVRNKLYFDAGRYAAGVRDRESIEAHMKLKSRVLNAKKRKQQ